MNMTIFNSFFGQASSIFPFLMAAPAYFATGGTMELGALMRVVSAFRQVENQMNIFISLYATLADYRAVTLRLKGFNEAVANAQSKNDNFIRATDDMVALSNLVVSLPTGQVMVTAPALTFAKGKDVLVTGLSGSGKSTVFRAIAGLWPYGTGKITTPKNMLLIPQKPYLPIGTLRDALCYPTDTKYDDETLINALKTVKLEHLEDELDIEKPWHLTLSGGEQQRLSLARAVLIKPDWLFLDEATAAMDEPTEALLYKGLKQALPNTTIISIGHRSTLLNFHDKRINIVKSGDHFEAYYAPLIIKS
jgi:vitamin B12/bleomycin/antimicrobial peptide transport system ATP-binding/permease protein